MIAEFTAAIAAVSQTAKLIGTVLETTSDTKSKQAIAGLQNGILDLQAKVYAAQAKYQELAEINRETEHKLKAYEKWDSESARYQLAELVPGIFVYALKPEQAHGEPVHYLCPHCFQQRKKAILHRPAADYTNYVCDGCKFDVRPANTPHPMIVSVPRHRSRSLDGL